MVGEVRRLAGGVVSARVVGTEDPSSGLDPDRMRAQAARLLEDALGDHLRQALERIETEHRKNLNDLWRDQTTVLSRLCDEIEQVLQLRQQDERALQERVIEFTLAAVERRLMPEIEDLRLLLRQQKAELSQSAENPPPRSSSLAMWLVIGVVAAFVGGALFAPELSQVLKTAWGS
jgi:hypothetical protein